MRKIHEEKGEWGRRRERRKEENEGRGLIIKTISNARMAEV